MDDSCEKRENTYKVLVVGDVGTGKTSFIRRYCEQAFSIHYKATIGSDFRMKLLDWEENLKIRLQLWDIAGQERFGMMTRVYYKDAVGAFVVFDVTRAATFEAVEKWKDDLDNKALLPNTCTVPAVLLANKCDQESLFKRDKIDKLCKDKGFVGWFETSAKENIGLDEAVNFLVKKILVSQREIPATPVDCSVISSLNPNQESNSCCSWHHKTSKSPRSDSGKQD